jgi:TatD DNase family protein
MAGLADSHVHLDAYTPGDVTAMLARARAAGVSSFLAVGVDLASSEATVRLAGVHEGVLAAVGLHPARATEQDPEGVVRGLRSLAGQPRVAAIGEAGLDAGSGAGMDQQEALFAAQVRLAAELGLPLVLHVAGAHDRALAILKEAPPPRTVVHYFQGNARLAASYLELGCFISVGKPVTRAEQAALRDAVRGIPLDRLLLETDTYPLPGRSTEPRDVTLVCGAVAALHGVPAEAVAAATTANFASVFGSGAGVRW